MNQTLLSGGFFSASTLGGGGGNGIGNSEPGMAVGGGGNSASSVTGGLSSSAGSSTASSPTGSNHNSSNNAMLPPVSKLFPSLVFGNSTLHSQMLNHAQKPTAATAQTMLRQSVSSSSLVNGDQLSSPSPPKSDNFGRPKGTSSSTAFQDPFAQLFAMPHQQQPTAAQNAFAAMLNPTTVTERLAMTAAAMQLMAAAAASNGTNGGTAAAFMPSLLASATNPMAGFYPCWPTFAQQHLAAATAAASFQQQQQQQHGTRNGMQQQQQHRQHHQNGSASRNNAGQQPSSTPPTPTTAMAASGLELHQQMALAWHSQLLALGMLSQSLGGGVPSSAGASLFPGMAALSAAAAANNGQRVQQQHLGSSEDEANAFLAAAFGQQKQPQPSMKYAARDAEAGTGIDGCASTTPKREKMMGKAKLQQKQEEQPLDLTAKPPLQKTPSRQSAKGQASKKAMATMASMDNPAQRQEKQTAAALPPALVKNESLRALDEETAVAQLLEPDEEEEEEEDADGDGDGHQLMMSPEIGGGNGTLGLLLEDGSEAESPKLGTKKSYSQADLDAAVNAIRQRHLGTRRASVVYGIPRSTLRNKIYKLEAAADGTAAEKCGPSPSKRRRPNPTALTTPLKTTVASAAAGGGGGGESSGTTASEATGNGQTGEEDLEEACHGQQQNGCANANSPPMEQKPIVPSLPSAAAQPSPLANNAELFKELSGQLGQFMVEQLQQQQRKAQQHQTRKMPKSAGGKLAGGGESVGDTPKSMMEEASRERRRSSSTQSPQSALDQQLAGKVNRPLRGKYRKYDKTALDKAVEAVKRKEMSVHRAGSYFGVPHSTLEYKVKERNLLPKKKKPPHANNGGTSNGGIGTLSTTTLPALLGANAIKALQQQQQCWSPVTGEVETMLATLMDSVAAAAAGSGVPSPSPAAD